MSCSDLQSQYNKIKLLKSQYEAAFSLGNLPETRKLHQELETQRQSLIEQIWPFDKDSFSRETFHKQYQNIIDGYRELGIIESLERGGYGIRDEQGKVYLLPTEKEILSALRKDQDFYNEKFATLENPRIHITPFLLSPRSLSEKYAKQIEAHFVEARIEGDRRIPDPQRTRLFGADGTALKLRADHENVYFSESLDSLSYFPTWQRKRDSTIEAIGGLTKEQALEQTGPFRLLILEDISFAPEQNQGKTIEKDIKIKGKIKKVQRKQVEGGKDAADQYQALKNLKEEGLTPEDYLSYALLYLRENNKVLDDDRNTWYYVRLLGCATASSGVPGSYWNRYSRQAYLGRFGPSNHISNYGSRSAVRVF